MKKNDADLLKVRSFGKTSLREVKRKLADMGLSLGMDLDAVVPGAVTAGGGDDADTEDESEDELQNAGAAGDGENA